MKTLGKIGDTLRTSDFIQRLGIAYRFLRYGRGKCRIMACSNCGSVFIKPISEKPAEMSFSDQDRYIDLIWSEIDQCMNCGAVCQELQLWNYDGDPCKINKDITIIKEDEEKQK